MKIHYFFAFFALLCMLALAGCVFDKKDSCLDAGGSYDEATQTCLTSSGVLR